MVKGLKRCRGCYDRRMLSWSASRRGSYYLRRGKMLMSAMKRLFDVGVHLGGWSYLRGRTNRIRGLVIVLN